MREPTHAPTVDARLAARKRRGWRTNIKLAARDGAGNLTTGNRTVKLKR